MKKLIFIFLLIPSLAWSQEYYRADTLAECKALASDIDAKYGYPNLPTKTTKYADCKCNSSGICIMLMDSVYSPKTGELRRDPKTVMSGAEKLKIKTRAELKRDDGFFPDPKLP